MATEILRPNAVGDEANCAANGSAIHYENVDEATPDDATTYNSNYTYSGTEDWLRDLHNIADHVAGSGTINHITVYARVYNGSSEGHLKIAIKSGTGSGAPDTVTEDDSIVVTNSWTTQSNQWATNPKTSAAWTWDEIDKLQIGYNLGAYSNSRTDCTQVYVEVDYTAVTFIPWAVII